MSHIYSLFPVLYCHSYHLSQGLSYSCLENCISIEIGYSAVILSLPQNGLCSCRISLPRTWGLEKSPVEEINNTANQHLGFKGYQETAGPFLKLNQSSKCNLISVHAKLNTLGNACITRHWLLNEIQTWTLPLHTCVHTQILNLNAHWTLPQSFKRADAKYFVRSGVWALRFYRAP